MVASRGLRREGEKIRYVFTVFHEKREMRMRSEKERRKKMREMMGSLAKGL